ncbi:hypothetical protein [Tessaracoccus sp. OH4464_COT-324]|uniref:hypothetical protein n=1 Tax=Tessaracoccus sp. OH4464_COT-324 TaxID=2491059 RepID=UPI000F63BFCA|nr:hypothetical protein [Tessaracoccus sp. OH4464_COT-324]RRD47562.1 hypothetical protein EII42_02965 [Tessaracoccus sp. OH4464_COT-324]
MQATPYFDRRNLIRATAAALIAPGLAGCQLGAVISNPAVTEWLKGFASDLLAEAALDLLTDVSAVLRDGFHKAYQEWLPGDTASLTELDFGKVYCDQERTVLFAGVSDQRENQQRGTNRGASDPRTDWCFIVFAQGEQSLKLPPWAWQGLHMFIQEMSTSAEAESGNRVRKLLAATLTPTALETNQVTSCAEAVEAVSYQGGYGPVDVALVEQPDHSHYVLVKAAGFPDAENGPTVAQYDLPTAAG